MTLNFMMNFVEWTATPEIVSWLPIRWYGLMFALSFVASFVVLQHMCKLENISKDHMDGITTAGILGTVIGARLGHCLFYEPAYYLQNPLEILMVWQGGLASHGATLGILTAFFIYSRRGKIDLMWIYSRVAVLIPLAAGLIRMGNLMNSEIYGHVTSMPWGFLFANSSDVLSGAEKLEPRHPTQIYEALAYFSTYIVFVTYYFRTKDKSKINNEFIIGYLFFSIFVFRFFVEYLKNNQVDFESGMPFNMGQLLSLPFIAMGGYLLYMAYTGKKLRLGGAGK